eukprot:gene10411-23024_t
MWPRLLMLGGGGAPRRLLLVGGRLLTESLIDIPIAHTSPGQPAHSKVWVCSDGMGRHWDQTHSVSYTSGSQKIEFLSHTRQFSCDPLLHWHNRLAPDAMKLWYQFNVTEVVNSTTSYASLVKLDPVTALIYYEGHTVSPTPGRVGDHMMFSSRISFTEAAI